MKLHLILIIHRSCICEFSYSLKFISNSPNPYPGDFVVIQGHTQSRDNWIIQLARTQLRLNKSTFFLPVSAPILQTSVPFPVYLVPCFIIFVFWHFIIFGFLLVISLFKIAPNTVLEGCLVALSWEGYWCRKHVCYISFLQAWVYSAAGVPSTLMNQYYVLNKVSLNRNT